MRAGPLALEELSELVRDSTCCVICVPDDAVDSLADSSREGRGLSGSRILPPKCGISRQSVEIQDDRAVCWDLVGKCVSVYL